YISFDGPGGDLAHALLSNLDYRGIVHFDEAETWSTSSNGTNLFQLATHQFGHVLGLEDSKVRTAAVMHSIHDY
ncbi:hypothetical protein DAPPUDRAFT_7096, partial [Daphnia pulex]